MASRIPFCHSVVMFRRAAWREAGGYPLVDKLIDFRLWIAIGSRGWQFACLPEILGEHFVYSESYFHRTFAYRASQRELARAQAFAIEALHLPFWSRIYPWGRLVYWSLPDGLKRVARRVLACSREQDVPERLIAVNIARRVIRSRLPAKMRAYQLASSSMAVLWRG